MSSRKSKKRTANSDLIGIGMPLWGLVLLVLACILAILLVLLLVRYV